VIQVIVTLSIGELLAHYLTGEVLLVCNEMVTYDVFEIHEKKSLDFEVSCIQGLGILVLEILYGRKEKVVEVNIEADKTEEVFDIYAQRKHLHNIFYIALLHKDPDDVFCRTLFGDCIKTV